MNKEMNKPLLLGSALFNLFFIPIYQRILPKRVLFTEASIKLMIIIGWIKWYDAPHLCNNPFILIRIRLEEGQ